MSLFMLSRVISLKAFGILMWSGSYRVYFVQLEMQVGRSCWMWVNLRKSVRMSLTGAQLEEQLLSYSKNLYLLEQLMVDLCYCLSLAFYGVAMDGDQFSLVIDLGLVFIKMSSQVDHHLDKLSARENRWIKFITSIDFKTSGVLMRRDRCARYSHGRVGYWMGKDPE